MTLGELYISDRLELTESGIFATDSLGNPTFSLYANTGNAVFAGELSAASGTFAGTLSAADGEFTGTLTGADGDFSGDLTGSTGTFGETNQGHAILGISANPLQIKNNTTTLMNLTSAGVLTFAGFTASNSSLLAGSTNATRVGMATTGMAF